MTFSLRRYGVYFGLAACILFTLNYFRNDLATRAGITSAPGTPSAPSAGEGPAGKLASDAKQGGFSWGDVQTRYPVQNLTPLPTSKPLQLPKVQHTFPPESAEHAQTRKARQATVRVTFERCWQAYREHSWMKDELSPISGGFSDNFGGWAANLVDNLDSLWIMGFNSKAAGSPDYFHEAVAAAVDIDLSKSTTETVNVFETTIRHLGGFLSAYDLSGDKRLLEKAIEFGDMLLVAFDTPNRMPITRWRPSEALKGEQEADKVVLVAEIGSLSMEFTHLSQVTGDPKWYDAVDRITQVFAAQQDSTHLPGMWPVIVSGREKDFAQDTIFTLSAMSDSLYEYFPKMHALLGGTEAMYKKLFDGSMSTAIKYALWRPMTPDNADILISGNVRATSPATALLEPQGQHLVCFAGGMFALGGRLFHQPAHVEIGSKLTEGCIWTYKALPLGIMPEVFNMVPCESRLTCAWDEQKWLDAVASRSSDKIDAREIAKHKRLPRGFTEITDRRYILRPEAIESVFIMYRITGEQHYQDVAWEMFTAISNATETHLANAALSDISFSREELAQGTTGGTTQMDSMESFWMAETLKYFYLVFSEPDVVSLDEWVFNTEAHPFKRRLQG